ncbi:Putative peptidase S10, serine carboxypeptidase, propeptide, carboxypeptidase Y [Septoria linicola]|uniref:Carboxypeptidase n=1 Tax=Septoria linicola TaxID=215465 RepID=A0A9Q9AP88_9PEZI|nr:putative peptidase S10, serine carboxypeptidase, propeptide, carboxypeptidase Y [Septoria linicola]USW49693.1 Putative peptidase S10, serine carboxypeptidase, propeptide, carboxypeptidase Y [Septoria linicola]
MKVATSALLIGVAAAAVPQQQQPLQPPQVVQDAFKSAGEKVSGWSKPLKNLQKELKHLTKEAQDVWEEVAMLFPEEMSKAAFFSSPKPHTRKHEREWDYVTKGLDIEQLYTTNSKGDQQREIDGQLENFNLRTKKVDPKSLGVDKVKQYSGYLDNEEDDKHLFYWFFESRNDPKNDPVVLWLNGGPGCSSLTGLFMELGPSFIGKDRKPVYNPSSWNANASVIFLDQPVNVGYSYSGNAVSSTVAAGKDVYALLTLFFKQFPEYAKQPFHISGESYAGHYIPVFASEILSHKNRNINLQSVLIGNGLTDGLTQYEYYRPMACGDGGWPAVLDESACQSMDNALPRCQSLIENCYKSESVWSCVPASIYCNNALIGPFQRTGQNPYDVREKCKGGNLCYDELNWIQEYLNQADVMKALGAEVDSYDSCNMDINRNFLFNGDWMQPFHRLVPGILKEIPVLIYAGDADFICNWLGNLAWTKALEWPGQKAYVKAPYEDLTLQSDDKTKIGSVKSSGNFTFIRIHGAGHMVPYNQPEASLDFLNRWIGGEWIEN